MGLEYIQSPSICDFNNFAGGLSCDMTGHMISNNGNMHSHEKKFKNNK